MARVGLRGLALCLCDWTGWPGGAGLPHRRIHSFDLGSLGGAKVGEQFVNTVFPQRLSLTFGDSSWTGCSDAFFHLAPSPPSLGVGAGVSGSLAVRCVLGARLTARCRAVPEYVSEHQSLACDLLHIDGGHFDFTPWNDLVELARSLAFMCVCLCVSLFPSSIV